MMKRLSVMLALVSILVMSCASPLPALTIPSPEPTSSGSLEIVSEKVISPIVNVDYTRQLVANQQGCSWRIVSGYFPTGSIRLSSSGLFSGLATKYGESGKFTLEVSKGSEVISREFTYSVGDVVWASPASVDVSNFHPGARAEYYIKVHNDASEINEQKRVTTDATDVPEADGTVSVNIPLNQQIHDNNISNVIAIQSSNSGDKLRAVSYANRSLVVSGFQPLTERIINVKYVADAMFAVSYETTTIDVENMVSISDTSFTLGPHETKEILVAIDMPQSFKTDVKQFYFRINTGRATTKQGPLTLATVNAVTWNVRMR